VKPISFKHKKTGIRFKEVSPIDYSHVYEPEYNTVSELKTDVPKFPGEGDVGYSLKKVKLETFKDEIKNWHKKSIINPFDLGIYTSIPGFRFFEVNPDSVPDGLKAFREYLFFRPTISRSMKPKTLKHFGDILG